jgi:hypothetical protein
MMLTVGSANRFSARPPESTFLYRQRRAKRGLCRGFAPPEILKNHFANHAFENFEIASYESLIAMAEATGKSGHVPALRKTLDEEQRMATWLREQTPAITLRYMQLYEQGRKADR